MNAPYYADENVTLWHGDCRDILPTLDVTPDACVTDPPYEETVASWDRWPDGWIDAVGNVLPASSSLWLFGSTKLMLARAHEFAGWKYTQEMLWGKRNGTGPVGRDRLNRVHEWAFHWYRGRWSDLHHEWEREPYTGPDKGYVRKDSRAAAHQREGRQNAWQDDGTRQPRSLTYIVEAPSVRYAKRHQDEKPLACVIPLVRECTPPGGLVLDPMAGAGTTAVAARLLGRRALLIEGHERHCEQIVHRLQSELALA